VLGENIFRDSALYDEAFEHVLRNRKTTAQSAKVETGFADKLCDEK
jgi:hypothetical protein